MCEACGTEFCSDCGGNMSAVEAHGVHCHRRGCPDDKEVLPDNFALTMDERCEECIRMAKCCRCNKPKELTEDGDVQMEETRFAK